MIEYYDADVRVRYAETDQMGVVYHANYLVWFEVGRVELIRALGRPTTRELAREYLIETAPAQRPALFANHPKSGTARAELADVFGLMEDRSALPALEELKRDSDSDVARNAERAIRRITAATRVD